MLNALRHKQEGLSNDEPRVAANGSGEIAGEDTIPAGLPARYNSTYIEALVRDPLWVFVFWEIRCADKTKYEREENFGGYYLRVQPENAETGSFSVQVGNTDTAWYLGFPPGGGKFKVELCFETGSGFKTIACSKTFRLPRLLNKQGDNEKLKEKPLIALSGLDDFPVLRNDTRDSRVPHTKE
jgi:hypothetical protein